MKRSLGLGLVGAVLFVPISASAEVVWVGDFEGGNLDEWSGVLNGETISVVGDPTSSGTQAGRIQLTNDSVWPNGLKRVELNHRPDDARTAEGAQTFFAWSFYLPETLPDDPSQQIGYWESNQSYQQMMAFEVSGENIRFDTRQPQNQNHWNQDGVVTAGTWHRIAMRIFWSKDPAQGQVDVWFDGEQVVTGAGAKTLADDNAHFTQVGLLRGAFEFNDSPVIVIDDAAEGDTLEDVRPDALSEGTGGSGGSGPGPATTAAATTGSGPSSSAATGAGATTGSGAGGGAAEDGDADDDGCRSSTGGFAGAWALLARAIAA
ncbi:MAG: concanavalin A-like lectin/glucanase-domain-containing protein, partial [Polyangiaceae bacterium]|nr:concanavalin A-like lectin/glucanase-domain-containing protein [Polyangiaceae bacterium]